MYLSGIEILFQNTGNRMSLTPNCTLVELKFISRVERDNSIYSKLYLSGIEIMADALRKDLYILQIVP